MHFSTIVFCLILIFLPIVLACILEFNNKEDIKENWYYILGIMIITNIIVVLVWLPTKQYLTKYEFLLINALLATIFSLLIVPKFQKKNIVCEQVLKFIAVCSIIIAVYSILTYGQTVIHSDVSTAVLLAKSQIENHSFFPRTWNYGNGDVWVLGTNLLILPFFHLMHNYSLIRMLASVILIFLAVLAMRYQANTGFEDQSWLIAVPFVLLYLAKGQGDCVLYQAAYISNIIWIPIVSLWSYKLIHNKHNIKYKILVSLTLFLLGMSGIRYFAELVLPLLGACIILCYFEIRNEEFQDIKSKIIKIIPNCIIILVSSFIGFGMHLYIASTHTLNSGENDEVVFVKSWLGNIPVAIENFFGCFGYQSKVSVFSVDGIENLILIFAALLLIFVFPILQAIKIKNEKAYTKYFFTFGVIHNLIMIMMVVFFGKLATRYLLSSVFVCILISARYIYKYWFMQKSVEKYVWITIYGVMTCYLGVVLLLQSIGWTTQLAKEKGFNQQLLDMGITKAYATYWNAYNNQIYSDMKINYAGIDIYGECIKPHKWLVDNSAFEKEDGKSALILDKKENKYIKEHFGYLLDWSIETFKKNGLYVYIYDDDIADEIYNGLEDNKLLPSELLSTGKREKNAYVLNNGDWVYGPYAPIETGSYIVKYQGDNLENVMCDVYCEGKQNAYIEFEEISRNENEVTLRVQFDKEIDSTEFRLCNTSGKETAVLYQIVVERE